MCSIVFAPVVRFRAVSMVAMVSVKGYNIGACAAMRESPSEVLRTIASFVRRRDQGGSACARAAQVAAEDAKTPADLARTSNGSCGGA